MFAHLRLVSLAFGLLSLGAACNRAELGGTDGTPDLSAPVPTLEQDFPREPIRDTQGPEPLPADPGALFGSDDASGQSGGPCVSEPEIGALLPRNWLRPRIRFAATAGQNLFEIRIKVDNQQNDLIVYTTSTQWTMPAEIWAGLAGHSTDRPITLSVRGVQVMNGQPVGKPAFGSRGTFTIAPADAAGTIVYWTTTGGTVLKGFKIGQETVTDVLRPAQVGGAAQCVGCHTSTPDGNFVAFSTSDSAGNGDPAYLSMRSVDGRATEPSYLTAAARTLLGRQKQHAPVFSAGHFTTGDRIAVAAYQASGTGPYGLAWIDLEASSTAQGTGWGMLSRTGDARMSGGPVFTRQGDRIVYVSATSVGSGVTATDGDLVSIPYNNRMGGAATPVPGASEAAHNEYYPTFSPDDAFLAYNRVPSGESSYNNPKAEVFVLPSQGGTPTRLAANDPPSCGTAKSPGALNSWAKWSPEVQTVNGKRYYWIVFSSTRAGGPPQLYITGVTVDAAGTVETHKALYLWNQPATEGNHTAAWDVFKIVVG